MCCCVNWLDDHFVNLYTHTKRKVLSLPAMKGNTLKEITWLLCIAQLIGGRTCLQPRLSDLSWSVFVITLTHIDNIAQFSCSVVFDSLQPHGLQYTRIPCPSPTVRACSNSCSLSQWCHPTISSSVVPFSFCLQSCPASGFFLTSQFFISGDQNIGDSPSVSVPQMNTQNWFHSGLPGLISLQSKGLSRLFSGTTVQKHQFFGTPLSLWFSSHIVHDCRKNHSLD